MNCWSANQGPIEKNVPIPEIGRPVLYPWHGMQVGESFMVRCPKCELQRLTNTLTSCASRAARRSGFKFAIRRVNGGVRAWRIA